MKAHDELKYEDYRNFLFNRLNRRHQMNRTASKDQT